MKDTIIKLQGVTKTYSGYRNALNRIDLEIEKGEFVFLLGPNGAGKTTLLKLLWMEEEPSSGIVFIDRYNSLERDQRKLAELRHKLGIVFEDLKLMKKRSLEENLSFPLRIKKEKEKNIRAKVAELLGVFNLYSKRKSCPEETSAGERKKLAIARAVISEPLIVLADEPFGGLDGKVSSEIVDFLKGVNFKGTTVVLTTYRADIAGGFKGRIVHLENGEIRR